MIKIDTKKPTSPVFNMIFYSFNDVFEANRNLYPLNTVPKIFRTAILANELYQEGHKKILEKDEIKNELLAILFESFIFYTRIVYDLSTDVLQKHTDQPISKSYNKLISSIKNNKIKEINGELKQFLIKGSSDISMGIN